MGIAWSNRHGISSGQRSGKDRGYRPESGGDVSGIIHGVGGKAPGEGNLYPEGLKRNGYLNSDTAKWSFKRMVSTPDVVLFWEKGFGPDITKAPDLDGHNMKVDLANLMSRLRSYYDYFYKDLAFVKPGTNAEKYKMMVMLEYSLRGVAMGGDYDGVIGALWVTPNRLQDEKLNCIAHELGHCYQLQIPCDGEGDAWGGSGFYEMTSQWMLRQVNPDWQKDEYFHLQAFADATHKAYLHIDNIYHSPTSLNFGARSTALRLLPNFTVRVK